MAQLPPISRRFLKFARCGLEPRFRPWRRQYHMAPPHIGKPVAVKIDYFDVHGSRARCFFEKRAALLPRRVAAGSTDFSKEFCAAGCELRNSIRESRSTWGSGEGLRFSAYFVPPGTSFLSEASPFAQTSHNRPGDAGLLHKVATSFSLCVDGAIQRRAR